MAWRAKTTTDTSGGESPGTALTASMPLQIIGSLLVCVLQICKWLTDLDLEIRHLDSILGAGLSPRIRYAIKTMTTTVGQQVLIVRVERSWSGPHRVIFQQR